MRNLFLPRNCCFWVLLVMVILPGCARAGGGSSPESITLRADGACALPCWDGLEPGVTPAGDARTRLVDLHGEGNVEAAGDVLSWHSANGVEGRAALREGRVGTIAIDLLEGRLTVEQVVAQIGAPESVYVSLPHPTGPDAPTRPCDVLRLAYPGLRTEVNLYDPEGGDVAPGQSVARLYFAPDRPTLTMMTPFYAGEWTGYGNYCVTVEELD